MAKLRYDHSGLTADAFIGLARRVWPRDYDVVRGFVAEKEVAAAHGR